jgi:hypothetical protein
MWIFLCYGPKNLIPARQEDMKINKSIFSALVLELFCPFQIQLLDIENPKIQKSTSLTP